MDDLTKKILISVLAVVIAIPALFGIYKLTTASDTPAKPINLDITDKDWSIGNKKAKNVLLEYGDLQCPACKAAYPYVKNIIDTHKNDVMVVFRHYPLPQHQNAMVAAVAAESAGLQNKFWEMQDLLYTNQDEWAETNNPNDYFIKYAQKLKLNVDEFKKNLSNKDLLTKIQAQQHSGDEIGINATPTFYLNGVQIDTGSLTNIDSLLVK